VKIGTTGFGAPPFSSNTIPVHIFAFAVGSQNTGVPLQIVESNVMLSDYLPTASAVMQQITSSSSTVVASENPNPSQEAIVVILSTPCQTRDID
jgi:hypothetical protein